MVVIGWRIILNITNEKYFCRTGICFASSFFFKQNTNTLFDFNANDSETFHKLTFLYLKKSSKTFNFFKGTKHILFFFIICLDILIWV